MADILLLDDSPDLQETFKVIFNMRKYGFRSALDKEEFEKEIKKRKPDLILMDVMLGNDDGREICKELKSNKTTHKIPVILMSASPKLVPDYKNYNADDFIEKSFSIDYLFKRINALTK